MAMELQNSQSKKKTHNPFSNYFFPLLMIGFLYLVFFFLFQLKEETPNSGIFLIAPFPVFFAWVVVRRGFVTKNSLISLPIFKNSSKERNRLGKDDSAKWFIGNESGDSVREERKKITREGVEFYSNGDFYEGEFHNGKSNGSGVYYYFANGRYEGDLIDGRYDGYGIESWPGGNRYRGQYSQGLRHGFGVYMFYTGDSYYGEWFNGQSHGFGVQKCSDGSFYVGEFKCGTKHGLGCYHFSNGDRYAGEYFGNKILGFGIYQFANGHFYEGSWHEGQKQGFGVYTFRNDDMLHGEWHCGVLKSPHPPLTAAVQHAVQSARKAAENAIRLPRMDEHVNKAVTTANWAVNAARVAALKAAQCRMDGNLCETEV